MMNRKNLIFFTGTSTVLLLSLAAWLFLQQKGMSQSVAVITYQGQTIRTVDLSAVTDTETITVGQSGAENIIQISPEGIGIIQADCPDQICVRQGIRSHGPEPIICLPHRLSIRFAEKNESGLDAITGR